VIGKEKGAIMKFATATKTLVLALALVLSASAFAATKASLQLSHPVTVNGTTLRPGDYKLQWEGDGPNVELSFLQGKNVLAKTSAHVIDLQTPSANTAALTHENGSGPNALTGIRFEGKKLALELGEASEGMQAGSSK
jgi:hypothetical protein